MMASGGAIGTTDDLFELFECPVCLDSVIDKHPRLLHCGHTFCTQCLEQIAEWDNIFCPKCRQKTRIPHGIEGLAKNTDLVKMKEREIELKHKVTHIETGRKCQICKHSAAEYICTKCKKRMICKYCAQKHKTTSALRSHKLLPMTEDTDLDLNDQCDIHMESLIYYCQICQEALCIMCLHHDHGIHNNHDNEIVELQDAIDRKMEELNLLKKSELTLQPPKLVSKIKVKEFEIENVSNVANVGDGTVIVVMGKKWVYRIDRNGNVIGKYHVEWRCNITSWSFASICNGILFLGSGCGTIAKLPLDDPTNVVYFEPLACLGQACFSGITAIQPNRILLSIHFIFLPSNDRTLQMAKYDKLLEFNTDTHKIKVNACDVYYPGKVCVANSGVFTKYIVSYRPDPDSNVTKVIIYNNKWNLLHIIGDCNSNLQSPIVTPGGKLLLVEVFKNHTRNRVVEYNLDGEFVGSFFRTCDENLDCIVYSSPFLWILHKNVFPLEEDKTAKLEVYLVETLHEAVATLHSDAHQLSDFISKYKQNILVLFTAAFMILTALFIHKFTL